VSAYYNEIDPYAAAWLRNLIDAGHIAAGDVDERSIVDVRADDLRGYTQCHFFAGIGGWSLALRLAGWPDDRPVWTGSCPCQPFSAAGAGKAADDERHLWPAWFPLIAERRPAIVFGEQVEAAIGWGWLDAVFADLEDEGYACGTAVLPACGVGAPHIRQRCWFVADAGHDGRAAWASRSEHEPEPSIGKERGSRCADGELAHANGRDASPEGRPSAGCGSSAGGGGVGGMVNAAGEQVGLPGRTRQSGISHWSDAEFIPCTDGKSRPVEPGTFPLAHGIPGRVGRLRAYGNAITPQCAAEFIASVSNGRL
jgi:DNA (cytosine-5)-methyltransferase 1